MESSNGAAPALETGPREALEGVLYEIKRVIVGQDAMLERLLVALLTGGHVLLEGVPGLAKTLTVKTLAEVVSGSFRRIQFTPDLVPADLVGTRIYRPDSGTFDVELGPVFCNFLLADEINRAPAKVQSALLEVMQEHQVTIAGHTYPVPQPFLVLATQNPIESEGTYPLPEAQTDRFLMKLVVGLPEPRRGGGRRRPLARAAPGRATPGRGVRPAPVPRRGARGSYVDREVIGYAVALADATRNPEACGSGELAGYVELRRQPARTDRACAGGSCAGAAARSTHVALGRPRPRARRPAPPPGADLRGAGRRREGRPACSTRSWPPSSPTPASRRVRSSPRL